MVESSYTKGKWAYVGYPFLLIIFFMLHQWRLHFFVVSMSEVFKAALILVVISAGIFFISKYFFKCRWKALFVVFVVCFLLLFINPVLSFLNLWRIASSLGAQLLLIIIISAIAISAVRQLQKPPRRFLLFVNVALIVLVCVEIVLFFLEGNHKKYPITSVIKLGGKSVSKLPSVYLIVFDEYAGRESLIKNFHYDNSAQIKELEDRGFKVIKDATSNYQHTVLSMPSIFNFDYITSSSGKPPYGENAFGQGLADMYYNHTFRLFRELGYNTFNYSPFEIDQNPASYQTPFLPQGVMLILHSSLIGKASAGLPAKILTLFGEKEWIESYYSKIANQQKGLLEQTLKTAGNYKFQPVFSYTHLMLPHAPYLYDSSGKINTEYLSKKSPLITVQQAAYIHSLSYANKLMLHFFDELSKQISREAVVIIMSDHGYKSSSFGNNISGQFNCFNAIYLRGNSASLWYDGMSNVNQFRVLFNTITKSNIPLLKDSIIQN